jgi:exosome complex component MTR3
MLSLYPKSAISIVVTVIAGSKGNFKSLLAAATTASSMALVDAGISLRDIVTAGSVYVSRKVNENTELKLLVDPEMDTKEGDVDAVVSYQCALNSCITGIWIDGDSLSHEVTDQIVACTKGVATQVRQLMNGLVIERFKEKEQLVTTIAR